MAFQAAIFDMDGLMLDTERLGRIAWDRAGHELNLNVPDDFYLKMVGRRIQEVDGIIRDALGPGIPVADYIARANAHYHSLVHDTVPPLKSGIIALLDFLQERRVPLAVGTSTQAKSAMRSLESTGLARYFSEFATGDQVEQGKPAPDIFLLAARKLGVPADRCVVLEDSDYGVRAGHAAGATVYMVPDQSPPQPETRSLATRVFESLDEVLGHFTASPHLLQSER